MLKSGDFLYSLIQNSTDLITIIKQDGTVLFQSPSVERLYGFAENELIGTNIFQRIHPDDLTGVIDAFNRVTNNPDVMLTAICRVKHKDGGWRILESTGSNQLGNPLIHGIVVNSRDITERWQAEEALRTREAQLRTLVESLPFELFGIGMDGKYFLQNKVCREHWGNFIGIKPLEVTNDKNTTDIWLDNNRRAFAGEIVKGEIELMIKGEKTYMYNIISPIVNKGQVDGIVGFNIDITERRQIEEELRRSKATARSLLDVPNAVGFLLDRDGICLDANETVCRRFSKNLSDIVGKPIWDLLSKEVGKKRKTYFEQVLVTKKQVRFVDERQGLWNDSIMTPILDNNGEVEEVAIFGFDITELKKAEQRLRKSESWFRVIFEGTPNGIIIVDPETRKFRFVNPAMCKMLGYADSELLKLGVEDIHPEEDLLDTIDLFERFMRGEITMLSSLHIKRKDNSIFFANLHATHIEMDNSKYLIAIFTDVTELRKTEDELIRYRDHLEELIARRTEELTVINDQLRQAQKLEAVGLLAGGIAHDFNNILTTIKGAVYILSRKIDRDSPLAKYPEQMLSSIKKGTDLAQSLLAFSRKQTITLIHLDLNELINDSVTLLHRLVGEHIEIVLALENNLPCIMGDQNQIQQVLINLAANAKDAMPKEGRLTIRTGLIEIDETFKTKKGFGTLGKYVFLEVSDTGTGIEENVKGKIFEPFFTTKELVEGSGLGLSVTYGIVKQHNGFIDFDSIFHEGTTFRIYLRSARSDDSSPIKHKAISVNEDENSEKGSKTILLAEDDGDVRKITGDVLGTEGYTVIEAKDGVEALRLFTENLKNIHLAILDVRMPGKNGREVYEEIKRLRPETPVLFISGYTADIIESDGILREGLNFISKSATPEELLEKIRQII